MSETEGAEREREHPTETQSSRGAKTLEYAHAVDISYDTHALERVVFATNVLNVEQSSNITSLL